MDSNDVKFTLSELYDIKGFFRQQAFDLIKINDDSSLDEFIRDNFTIVAKAEKLIEKEVRYEEF